MNRKNILFIAGMVIPILLVLLLVPFSTKKKPRLKEAEVKSLLEFEPYHTIKIENIKKIELQKFTEGGTNSEIIEDADKIETTLYYLLNLKVGEETSQACEDNTTIYNLYTKENETLKVEIECDWIIIGNKRYKLA